MINLRQLATFGHKLGKPLCRISGENVQVTRPSTETVVIHLNIANMEDKYMYYLGMSDTDAKILRDKLNEVLCDGMER